MFASLSRHLPFQIAPQRIDRRVARGNRTILSVDRRHWLQIEKWKASLMFGFVDPRLKASCPLSLIDVLNQLLVPFNLSTSSLGRKRIDQQGERMVL